MSHMHTVNSNTSWGTLGLGWGAFVRLPAIWRARLAERRHLSQLDAHLLDDIGMDAERAQREATKPFWQA